MGTLLNTKTKTDLIKTIQKYQQENKRTRFSKRRRGINPNIIKKFKSLNLSWEEKNRLEANKEIIIPPQKRVRFKISSKLKKEIS